jgi:succinate dehydrogenase/fumarate reductase flavoprotein subunit
MAEYTAVPAEVSGDGIEMALDRGGALSSCNGDGAFWSPVSVRWRRDGSVSVFPHFFLDRGKPGCIAVDRTGRRFVNEASSYDAFVRSMYAANRSAPAVPCYLIADARAVRKYGLGLALPGGFRLRRLVAEGYIRRASSIEALAQQLGLDRAVLAETVARFNRQALAGEDSDFGRGRTAANQVLGDPDHRPNPCLGPLLRAPFYAVELRPGINGTSAGLVTDERARVLTAEGSPFDNLYACGNDMASLMDGTYPGPGITIGPALAFAHAAAVAMAEQAAGAATHGRHALRQAARSEEHRV